MAVTICVLLIAVLMMTAVTDAGFPKWRDDDSSFGFDDPMRYEYIRPLSFLSLPGFNMPPFPPIPWPTNFPKPQFGHVQTFSVPDMASQPAIPGSNFNAISVAAHSSATRDPDGKIKRTGETSFISNNNGHIVKKKFGDVPDEEFTEYTNGPFGDFHKEFKFEKHPFKMPTFEPFKMPTFEPFTMKPIDVNYVPGPNEKFKAESFSSSTHDETVNGVKKSGGEFKYKKNDNGKVDSKDLKYNIEPEE